MQKITAPRGTKDVLPSDIGQWQLIEQNARDVARRFGYIEIRFPTFEHTELFQRGVGDTTDIVQKEMYTFEDKGGRSITLRPEGTASVVRACIESSVFDGGLPLKLYYIAPNFRYEKPQAGRLREHHQFGVELFGSPLPAADVEVISMGAAYLKQNGVSNTILNLNTIGCPECRIKYNHLLTEYFTSHIDALCDTCRDRLSRNPLRILDCKNPECGKLKSSAPLTLDHLCSDCETHFEAVKSGLTAAGIEYIVNPRLVRGLDYYTRTVFEFVSSDIGAQGTVLAGGRYDNLVEQLGGGKVPGLGFGSGIERLILQRQAEGTRDSDSGSAALFLAAADDEGRVKCAAFAASLRSAGLAVEHDLMGRSLKAQMKYADKIGAKYTIVIGETEVTNGVAKLRSMQTHDETELTLTTDSIISAL